MQSVIMQKVQHTNRLKLINETHATDEICITNAGKNQTYAGGESG